MRRFKFILIVIVIATAMQAIAWAAPAPQFQAGQSYELADLVQHFMPDAGGKKPFLAWSLKDRQDNIFWDEKVSFFEKGEKLYLNNLSGQAGLLINGNSRQQTTQSWENGQLVKRTVEYGYSAQVRIRGPVYWNPVMVEIGVPMSPAMVQKLITGQAAAFEFGNYLSSQGLVAEQLWKYGYSSYGETAWYVQSEGKEPVWILCRTTHGVSGVVGSLTLGIFYSRADAEKDSGVTHYYP